MPASSGNPFFRLTIVVGGLFAFTVLSMTMATFGDPKAPPNRFFDSYGLTLIGIETVALIAVGLLAMTVDRRQTLRALRQESVATDADEDSGSLTNSRSSDVA